MDFPGELAWNASICLYELLSLGEHRAGWWRMHRVLRRHFRGMDFDMVITVCDDAAENCPVWLGKGKKVHLGFPDPAQATGSENQVMAAFRAIRDEMLEKIPGVLSGIS